MAKLYFIGLGLYDETSLTIQAKNAISSCKHIFAEFYTSILAGTQLDHLEKSLNTKIHVVGREFVEKDPDRMLEYAQKEDTAFLVAGDPMVATTHVDLRLRAKEKNIETIVIHGTSVYSAVAICGLQIYKFGKSVSIPYPQKGYFPTSPYDVIMANKKEGLHTVLFLDIHADVNRFMSISEAIDILFAMEEKKQGQLITKDIILVGMARLGSLEPAIKAGTPEQLKAFDFGASPHILVFPGKLHEMEEEGLQAFAGLQ